MSSNMRYVAKKKSLEGMAPSPTSPYGASEEKKSDGVQQEPTSNTQLVQANTQTPTKSNNNNKSPTSAATPEEKAVETSNSVVSSTQVKHPLQYRWTMWYNPPKNWNVTKIITFDTVEDFWCLFNNLVNASQLDSGSNFHLFKEGIEPQWEDPANKNGGKWIATFTRNEFQIADKAWMYTVLAIIGESFADSDEITGAVVSPRPKEIKIALWTKVASNEAAVMRIGATFKATIETSKNMSFQSHSDCMKHKSSFRNKHIYSI